MAAHRFWRLFNVSKLSSLIYVGITDIQMATAYAGPNVCTGGVAAANAVQAGGLEADKAFDGNLGTLWQANSGSDVSPGYWISYDFGAGNAKDIVEVRIAPNFGDVQRTFAWFKVQSSDDGITWVTEWYVLFSGNYVIGTYQTFQKPGALAACRYWALAGLQNGGGNNVFSAAEIQMRDTPGGTNRALGKTARASNTFPGLDPALAVDNNVNTTFGTDGQVPGATWAVDLAADYSLAEISMISRNDGNWTQTPYRAEIWKSADGTNFAYVNEYNVASYAGAGVTRTFTLTQPLGAIVQQLMLVGVDYEYEIPNRYVRFGLGGQIMGAFPLFIQKG